jgi:CheY-like chemotaxis protein
MTVRLLIVDDEAVIRVLLQRHFVANGYMVETAANGIEALQRLADAKYDIVISDLLMPEMDGHELLGRIRDEYPLVRVIVMTGAVSIDNMLACLREGAFTFVTKPLTDLAPLSDAVHVAAWIVQGWLEQLTLLQRMKAQPQALP